MDEGDIFFLVRFFDEDVLAWVQVEHFVLLVSFLEIFIKLSLVNEFFWLGIELVPNLRFFDLLVVLLKRFFNDFEVGVVFVERVSESVFRVNTIKRVELFLLKLLGNPFKWTLKREEFATVLVFYLVASIWELMFGEFPFALDMLDFSHFYHRKDHLLELFLLYFTLDSEVCENLGFFHFFV